MASLTIKQRQALEKIARQNIDISTLGNNKNYKPPSMPWMKKLMKWQREVIVSPSRLKALLCGRRAGKTFLLVYALIYKSLMKPNNNSFFIALSLDHAKRLVWATLKSIIENHSIPAKINNTEFSIAFSNGSTIMLKGCGDRREADKFRGDDYNLIIIDEASLFGAHITYLIDEVLGPAMEDYQGEIILSSTPNALCTGYFHKVTTNDCGYELIYKTVLENSKYPLWSGKKNWKTLSKEWLEEYKEERNWDDDNPIMQREWMARWVRDDSSLVIPFDDVVNKYSELPDGEWIYNFGLDLGYVDEFCISIIATNKYEPALHIVDCYKRSGLVTSKKIEVLKRYMDKYSPEVVVADSGGGGRVFLEDFEDVTGITIEPAQKVRKLEYVDLFADAFRTGHIKINEDLVTETEELKLLQWKDRAKCDVSGKDHFFDATLYIWRELLSRRKQNRPIKHIETPEELDKRIEADIIERIRLVEEEESFYY